MIEPTRADVGRAVVYRHRYPGGGVERGVITKFTPYTVFVRYGDDQNSKGTHRKDLEWEHGETAVDKISEARGA